MNRIEEIYNNPNLTTRYTSKWSQYFEVYDKYFSKFVGKNPTVLEIGVDNGGFLETLYHYFENATIFGVDINPKLQDVGLPNVRIIRGDQGNETFWDTFKHACPSLDVLIDDGSHFMNDQIITFNNLFPILNEGGIYLVEDTHSSYMSTFGGALGAPYTFIEFMKRIIDSLHLDYMNEEEQKRYTDLARYIKSMHFYDSVVVIEKGLRPKYEVTYVHRENYIR